MSEILRSKKYSDVKKRYFAALNIASAPSSLNSQKENVRNFSGLDENRNISEEDFDSFSVKKSQKITMKNYEDYPTNEFTSIHINTSKKSQLQISTPIPVPISSNNNDDLEKASFIPPHLFIERSNTNFAYKKKRIANLAI